jgi:hypothetical protein
MNEFFVVYLLYSFANRSKQTEDLFLLERGATLVQNFFAQINTTSVLHDNKEFTFLCFVKSLKSEDVLAV